MIPMTVRTEVGRLPTSVVSEMMLTMTTTTLMAMNRQQTKTMMIVIKASIVAVVIEAEHVKAVMAVLPLLWPTQTIRTATTTL